MNSLNSVLVEGNLTRDPVLAATPKGTPVCNFSLATNRFYRGEEEIEREVSFFDVETWSRLAERCGEQLAKGRSVRVVGRLKQDRWNDKDGNPRARVKIVAEHVEYRRAQVQEEETEEEETAVASEAADTGESAGVEEKEAALVY